MTMGTATVARTNVRTIVDMVPSQSPRARLSALPAWERRTARSSRRRRRGRGGSLDGGCDVLVDEFGVDGDGDGRPFAGGRDHLGPRVGGVAGRPHAGH